jgi:RNAse (barnase) inhibitor barstar
MFISMGGINKNRILTVNMSSNYSSAQDLFSDYAAKLSFPDYFGNNWNAFYDCLCDFSWLNFEIIIICHPTLSNLGEEDKKIFFDVISDAKNLWSKEDSKLVIFIFPPKVSDLRVI